MTTHIIDKHTGHFTTGDVEFAHGDIVEFYGQGDRQENSEFWLAFPRTLDLSLGNTVGGITTYTVEDPRIERQRVARYE